MPAATASPRPNASTLVLSGANTYSGGTGVGRHPGQQHQPAGRHHQQRLRGVRPGVERHHYRQFQAPASAAKQNTGTLTLSGSNNYAGGTTINGGTLALALASSLGGGTLAFNGGTLQTLQPRKARATPVTLAAGGGTIDTNGFSLGLGSTISGPGGLTRSAPALTFTGNGTYSGATAVNAGTLQAGIVNAFSANSAYTVAVGATLDLNGFNQTIGSLAGACAA